MTEEHIPYTYPPYVRWNDADGLIHAAGQSFLCTVSFCDIKLTGRIYQSNTTEDVNCAMCLAQAQGEGILP